jgi:hypothetical protein
MRRVTCSGAAWTATSTASPTSGDPPGPGPDGGHPLGTVTWGGDGHLYGTTFVGGSTGKGVAFQVL